MDRSRGSPAPLTGLTEGGDGGHRGGETLTHSHQRGQEFQLALDLKFLTKSRKPKCVCYVGIKGRQGIY